MIPATSQFACQLERLSFLLVRSADLKIGCASGLLCGKKKMRQSRCGSRLRRRRVSMPLTSSSRRHGAQLPPNPGPGPYHLCVGIAADNLAVNRARPYRTAFRLLKRVRKKLFVQFSPRWLNMSPRWSIATRSMRRPFPLELRVPKFPGGGKYCIQAGKAR